MEDDGKIDMRTREGRALRQPMRPPMRPDDPHLDAAARAKQIMDNLGDFGGNADEFYVPPGIFPDGYVGEWKTYSVLGAVDPSKQMELALTGWEPVPTSYWPQGMPPETKEPHISKKGMILMMRPKQISDMMKARADRDAKEQMRNKKEQLDGAPVGAFDGHNKGKPLSRINSDFNLALAVPE